MNFLQRGITGIIRKPGKTAILLILIFILGNIIAGTISIRQAVNNTESNLRAKIKPVATITLDINKIIPLSNNDQGFMPETLSVETFEKIGSLPYVKSFDYSNRIALESRSLQRYSSDNAMEYQNPSFFFQGVNNPQLIDLQEGIISLSEGRVFNEQEINNLSYVAIVSRNFAETNNLSVGSKITFENNVYDYTSIENNQVINSLPDIFSSQNYEFEIIGIFEPVKKAENSNNDLYISQMMEEEIENKIYAPNKVLNEANAFQRNESIKLDPETAHDAIFTDYSNIYILNDAQDLTAFKEEAASLVPDHYKVADTSESIEQISAPMKTMQGIVSLILYIAVAATLIILSLLITLFLRDRKHEIGIYFSLGEKKVNIAAQIVLEVAVVAVIAITLSLFTGNILAGSISETMLTNQIAADQAKDDESLFYSYSYSELDQMGYQSDINIDDVAKSYSVSLSLLTSLLFYAIGIGTVFLSTLIPIIYTLNLNPKKILI